MSRRTKSSSTTGQPPPSHPIEKYPEHRAFLMRSLDRNDTDLAALVELNHSLHEVKDAIVETCGEATLLDMGEGHVVLSNDGEGLEGDKIPQQGEHLCFDFLLRMKLRRRLLNRLARRLNRISRAMDGEDVNPPPPPKYGDLRLYIDPKAVNEFDEHWKRQNEARQRILLRREGIVPQPKRVGNAEAEAEDDDDHDDDESEKSATEEKAKTETAPKEKGEQNPTEEQAADESKAPEEKAVSENVEEQEAPGEKAADVSKPSDEKAAGDSKAAEESSTPADEAADESKATEVVKPSAEVVSSEQPESAPSAPGIEELVPSLEEDCATLKEYTDGYTRILNPETGEITYAVMSKPQEDHTNIKYGAGIGATHRSMSSREKELEFKRWQTALLAKIPDQPTFEELGMKNRVFGLEQRRKRLAENDESPKKKSKKASSDVDMKDDDAEDGNDANSPSKKKKKGEKAEEKKAEKETSFEGHGKPISLVAVPSFCEQDHKRIRFIHGDLVSAAINDHVRLRLAEATNSYNSALQHAQGMWTQRSRLQEDLTRMTRQRQMEESSTNNEHDVRVAIERSNWQRRKDEWEREKNQKILQSMHGQQPTGTPLTQAASVQPDQVQNTVGLTLGRVVDAVVFKAEQGNGGEEKFEDFVPPPAPQKNEEEEEARKQKHERMENAYRQNIATLTARIHRAEAERERAWKKMEKTKQEFEVGRRRTYMQAVPPIHSGTVAAVPRAFIYNVPDVPAYRPPARPRSTVSVSESKYSIARVRERILADGSVMPASELKKDANGLFQRPAGRTRKGMGWDAIQGRWVPEEQVPP